MKIKSTILNFFKNSKISLTNIALAVIILFIGISLYNSNNKVKELHTELIGKTEKFKRINKHVASLERRYVTQHEIQEKLKREWNTERSHLRGRVKILSNATYLIRERARKEGKSDIVYQGKTTKYLFNEVRFRKGPPIGYVLIFDDGRVVSKVYNHQIDVRTAVSRDEKKGTYDILSKADYILRSGHIKPDGKNWFGVRHPLAITGGSAVVDPVEKVFNMKSFYWTTQLNANINFTPNPAPGLGLSFAGYGNSKRDLDFKFLQFGAQYSSDENLGVTATPVMWRFAPNVFNNTYIGPGYYLDKSDNGYFVGLQIGF